MAKFDKQSLSQKYFFGMTLLHAHAHYICIDQKVLKNKHKSYLIGNRNKWPSLQSYHFVKN